MIPALRPDERKQSAFVRNYDIEAVRATESKNRPPGARIESIKGTNKNWMK